MENKEFQDLEAVFASIAESEDTPGPGTEEAALPSPEPAEENIPAVPYAGTENGPEMPMEPDAPGTQPQPCQEESVLSELERFLLEAIPAVAPEVPENPFPSQETSLPEPSPETAAPAVPEADPLPPEPAEPESAQPPLTQGEPELPDLFPEEARMEQLDALDRELQDVTQLLEEKPSDEKFQETEDDQGKFSEMVQTPPKKAPIPSHERPTRKGRPRRKKGEGFFGIPNIVATFVWLAIVVAIGVTLGRMLWVCAADVLAFGREDRAVTITIYETDTIDDITEKLHNANLIRYPGLFKLYAKLAVDEGEIRPGIWDLNTRYDYHALVNMMSPSSSRSVVELMIPEGYSCRQIFALLEENKICTAQDIASYAATGELDEYWFLEGVERGTENCLEGFLFPDTYQFYTNDSPRSVLQKMLDNFDYRFDEEMRSQVASVNAEISEMMLQDGRSQEYVDSHQLSLRDIVIVASMIEKETSSAEEGFDIASVIYNRLYSWGDTPPYLNIDASMVYALNKTDLTPEDLRIDHPYNTYLYTGLTPGPISNPGLSSLKAALDPNDTNYYYYVLDKSTGSHHFSTTYDEHQAFIASQGE